MTQTHHTSVFLEKHSSANLEKNSEMWKMSNTRDLFILLMQTFKVSTSFLY